MYAFERLAAFELGVAVEVFALERPELDVEWYLLAACFPAVDVDQQRIAAGTALLEQTDIPVEHVGALVGIPSPAAFRRHFAGLMDVPPSAYRRMFSARPAA